MEVGRLAIMDQSRDEYQMKMQTVQETTKVTDLKVKDQERYKDSVQITNKDEFNEIIIDNIQFGFNLESKDFFVKIIKDGKEFKYPTDDMMKLKALLLKEMKEQMKKEQK